MDPVSEKFWTVLRKAQQRYASQCSRRANRSVATVSNGTRDLNRSASQEEAMEAPKEDSVERCKVTVALTLTRTPPQAQFLPTSEIFFLEKQIVSTRAVFPYKMLRRQARERQDYLYRRALLLRDASIAEKRAKLKASLASGKPLDPSIANDKTLREDFKYDESLQVPDKQNGDSDLMNIDDEYALTSGLVDPRPIITTSRSPSARLSAFAKEIRLLIPTSIRLNRGNTVLPDLVSSANAAALTDMVLLHEHRGTPTAMTISHLPHGPTASFSLHNVVLRADIPNAVRGTVSESYPHLIFEGFKTKLGARVVQIIKHLFPPREASKVGNRVVTFVNKEDNIEVRHHVFVKTGYRDVELAEVGPRMTMRLFEIRGGSLEKGSSGDVEWALTQYTRTSRKKEYL
ncbi:snoRNA-binding rRNA-processing protein imp4 [Monascus purpureus]|uniref:U3 small nucleolar ribonucleoprotein protein IMP4 n=1 Tax=Monascus purpureus TaxID=5098 RepID=A0A507R2N8_MONPU|nr:snoRNA-binding rRNA-processing protein imp4 [Monascus purpureus]